MGVKTYNYEDNMANNYATLVQDIMELGETNFRHLIEHVASTAPFMTRFLFELEQKYKYEPRDAARLLLDRVRCGVIYGSLEDACRKMGLGRAADLLNYGQ